MVARVLDDGITQAWRAEYNSRGLALKRIDPLGRETRYTYAANELDLLEIRQVSGATTELQAVFGNYTALHRPQSMTDAAGQTTTLTYNANGQVLTATDPLNRTTTFTYDTSGRPTSITKPFSGGCHELHLRRLRARPDGDELGWLSGHPGLRCVRPDDEEDVSGRHVHSTHLRSAGSA